MVNTISAESALKSYYIDGVTNVLNFQINDFLAMIEQTTNYVVGKDVKMAVKYGMAGGIGAGTETGKLPVYTDSTYTVLTANLKNLFGTIEISDKAIRASQNNEGALVNLLNAEMDSLTRAAQFNFGRMLFGDGNGTLATVESITSGVITVDSVRNLREGMVIDFRTSSGSEISSAKSRIISGVDFDNKTITLVGSPITTGLCPAGSKIVIQGSYGLELTGLGAIFDTSATSIYGLDKATNPWLKPIVKQSETIDDLIIQKYIDEVELRCGSKIDVIICSAGVRRALMEQIADKRMLVNSTDYEGGAGKMTFNGIPLIVDRFCPEGTMYLLNSKDFTLNQLCDWQWLEDENGSILKQIAGKAAYTATLVKYAELICARPNGQVKIYGITEA